MVSSKGTASTGDIKEKIYVEDYVSTFLRQAKDNCETDALLIDLYGKKEKEDGKTWFFVYAAGMPSDAHCFPDYEWLGQAHWQKGTEPEEHIAKIQKEVNSIHMILPDDQREPVFFTNEEGYVRIADTWFVFYEKNEPMQNYLIEWYRRSLKRGESEQSDRAAQDFRRLYQERQSDIRQNKIISLMYMASLMLMILCCITGISMLNQYDKMKQMGDSIDHLAIAMEERRLPEQTYAVPIQSGTESETEGDTEIEMESERQDSVPAMSNAVQTVLPDTISVEDSMIDETAENPDAGERYYIVKEGDTLAGISRMLYGTSTRLVDICELNQIQNPNNIVVGQKILLPND